MNASWEPLDYRKLVECTRIARKSIYCFAAISFKYMSKYKYYLPTINVNNRS